MTTSPGDGKRIGVYDLQPAAYRPYDPRYPEAASLVASMIRDDMPSVRVEHIGSTAVPGCGGKGNVDLLLLYPTGELARARDTLDAMGFQRWSGRDAFPESRPVRIGTIEHDAVVFRLHVHVVAEDSAEVAEQLEFREALRADSALVRTYEAHKREVIAAGITYGPDYARAKETFIRSVKRLPNACETN
jgi:GrpB-like predicted nucleotidyltransferase (UPF0157 family)